MSDPLIDSLARDYGLDADEATEMLRTLGQRLRDQAERGDDTSLPHVGRLSHDGEVLRFTPEDALAEALARRHGDLGPIQMSPPQPSAAEPEDAREKEFAPPPPASTEETTPEAATTPPGAEEYEAADEKQPAPTSPPPDPQEDSDLPPTPRRPHRPHQSSTSSDGQGRRILGVFLIILLVLVAGAALTFYLVYEGSIANLPFNVPGVAEPQTATEDAAPMPADTTANVLPLSPDTADSAVATDTTVGPAGLDRTAGGWTIIVGAYPTRPEADSMLAVFRQRLDDATAPVDTLTATDATRFRFRIAVGQYDTQTEAVSARQTLGEQLPADAWILRLQ